MLVFNIHKRLAVEYFVASVLAIALLFYGTSGALPWVTWITLSLYVLVAFVLTLTERLPVISVTSIGLILFFSAWLIPGIAFTPLYADKTIHVKMMLESFLYVISSVPLVLWLAKGGYTRIQAVFGVVIKIWLLVSFVFLVFYSIGMWSYKTTFSAMYVNRNLYAVVCSLLLCISLFFFPRSFKKAIICSSLVILVVLTSSIKGFVGIFIVLTLYYYKMLTLTKRYIFLLLMTSFTAVALWMNSFLWQRISRLFNDLVSFDLSGLSSGSERLWLLVNGFDLARDNWFSGIGLYNSKHYLFPPWRVLLAERRHESLEVGLYTHNNYLEVFLSLGVFSLILYYAPLIYGFFRSIKRKYQPNMFFKFSACVLFYRFFLDFSLVSYNSFPIIFFTLLAICLIFFNRNGNYGSSAQ